MIDALFGIVLGVALVCIIMLWGCFRVIRNQRDELDEVYEHLNQAYAVNNQLMRALFLRQEPKDEADWWKE